MNTAHLTVSWTKGADQEAIRYSLSTSGIDCLADAKQLRGVLNSVLMRDIEGAIAQLEEAEIERRVAERAVAEVVQEEASGT